MAKLITANDFGSLAASGSAPADIGIWRASTAVPEPAATGRVIRYRFSDPAVARDQHTIAADAWQIDNFRANPVFLWAHDSSLPPIGRVIEIGTVGDRLMGDVEYAEEGIFPFADTIYRLARGGYLNATSTGWLPIDWKFSTDPARRGGIDFKKVDLLEISQVPVPAVPTALVAARSAGIDTGPLYDWAEKLLDGGDVVLVPRGELEAMRSAAKMPTKKRATTATKPPRMVRGLYQVAWLAEILSSLSCLEDSVEWEAEYEGDGSPIPAQIVGVLKQLGQILVDMTAEEVAELLADDDAEEIDVTDVITMAKKSPAQRALIVLGRTFRKAARGNGKMTVELDLVPNAATRGVLDALNRAGRVLSAKNETDLRAATDLIAGVLEQVAAETEATIVEDSVVTLDAARATAITELLRRKSA